MRALLMCSLVVTSAAIAQRNPCLNYTPQTKAGIQVLQKQSILESTIRSRRVSPFQPAVGITEYMLDGKARTALTMGIQYVPTDSSSQKIVFNGGFFWSSRNAALMADPRSTGFGRSQFYPLGQSYGEYSPSAAVGFLGAEYRYYLLRGDFQPYLGVGAQLLGWRYDNRLGGTVAPSVLGGLSARISNAFDGFVELRHMLGIGNVLGGNSTFGGITSVSAGFAFAPSFLNW